MRFKVVGADSETGTDVDVVLEGASQTDIERIAHERHILVSAISPVAPAPVDSHPPHAGNGGHAPAAHAPVQPPAPPPLPAHAPAKKEEPEAISLVDDDPPASDGKPHERAHGLITVNANSPSETAHTGSGTIQQAHHADAAMEYHIILNQSLFLLESAVNKHILQGWEPQGGLSVGMANNALQFFQSMIRRKENKPK